MSAIETRENEDMNASVPQPHESSEIDMASLLAFLLRHRTVLFGVPFVCAAVVSVVSLFQAPVYTARTSFVPEAEGRATSGGALAGLASQFGIPLPSSDQNSPVFFAMVLESRSLRTDLLHSKFPDFGGKAPGDSAELIRYLESPSIDRGIRDLADIVKVEIDPRTNVTTVSVTTGSPDLSAQIANRAVALLNAHNTRTRSSRASEMRTFIEGRAAQTLLDLNRAELEMRRFREGNRQYASSPALADEYERLQRRIGIKQEVYVSQLRQIEEVRIAEVNSVTSTAVIDPAIPPEVRSGPQRTRNALFALAIGMIVGFGAAIVAEFAENLGRGDDTGTARLKQDWQRLRESARRR